MANLSISTGNVIFTSAKSDTKTSQHKESQAPMHIALVADFSGRGSRNEGGESLAQRKCHEVDRDNLEELFERFQVKLKLPFAEAPLAFSEMDDLHPDFLYEQLSLFAELRSLRRKLNNKATFDEAADEIRQWASFTHSLRESAPEPAAQVPATDVFGADMFDAILAQSPLDAYQQSPVGNINALIKDVVAPYVEPKDDPQLPLMLEAVDKATSQTLRRILHAPAYQRLEAAWRSVDMLTRRLETNSKLKLFLVDVSAEEIQQDLQSAETIEQSGLYKLLVEQRQNSGSTPFSIINMDAYLSDSLDDVRLASALAEIAQANAGVALTAASPRIAGCADLHRSDDPDDWHYSPSADFQHAWQQLRCAPSAAHLGVCAPGFLLRMPYGKKSAPIDSFPFEELTDTDPLKFYLWGNGAYLATLLMAQTYAQGGWPLGLGSVAKVSDLPLHIFSDEDGDSHARACAEVFLRDRAVEVFAEQGIMSLRSVKNEAAVLINNFRSIADSGAKLFA